ncbi:MAG: TlpA disulfide reductase family protein [Ghiorsea sp.]|nr:TlpA disulfide reductase family protein [Ghiorsea sp.]
MLANVSIYHFLVSCCPPCRKEMLPLVKWMKQHPVVRVVMVYLDRDSQNAQDFLAQNNIQVPRNVGNMRDAFALGVRGLPATLIIGAKGEINKRHIGDIEWGNKESRDEVLRWL